LNKTNLNNTLLVFNVWMKYVIKDNKNCYKEDTCNLLTSVNSNINNNKDTKKVVNYFYWYYNVS